MPALLNKLRGTDLLEPQPVEPLAHLLSSLGVGSAMYVAHADDPVAARREIAQCNERFVSGLGLDRFDREGRSKLAPDPIALPFPGALAVP